ncbi:MAG: lysophospholipid acyltransferase family protein [Urechidicola sp.]
MGLVTAKEVAKAVNLDKYGFVGTFCGWLLMKLLRISRLNKIYNRHKTKEGIHFLDSILSEFEIEFDVPKEDLDRIPKTGPFITISNHPLGGIDGILLLKLVLEKRGDYTTLGNFLMDRIKPLNPYILGVNPFETRKEVKSSVGGLKNALRHLRNGYPLGLFPAGEVSTHREGKLLVDKPWDPGAVRLIKKAEVPIIPIYFHAKNSRLFYALSKISDTFRTAKLPSELFSQKRRVIKVRIGKPILVKDQNQYENIDEFHQFIRKKTYMLANPFEKQSKYIFQAASALKFPKEPKKIDLQRNVDKMIKEVEFLRKKGDRLMESKNYEVFLAAAEIIPNILHEIGRLREITFREVGEGTNKSIDLDDFDQHYHHLFLWDSLNNKMVGAYRMGLGNAIYKKYGIKGFYVQTLFKFEPEMFTMMSETIDIGRAFIVKEYQQKPMPLFFLWKGIVHVTLRHPEHKYLTGGVSISNQFSNFSKSLMIEFMKSHYYDPYIAQYIHPKKEYKVKLKDTDREFVFDATQADLNKFDRVIDELEPGNLRMPVLIKKYIKQNAKLVAFNVDPKFNNAIDGLIFLKISDIPESTVRPVMEEFQAELEQKAAAAEENSK